MSRRHVDGIDTTRMRGVEFGALHNPSFSRDDPHVIFVDHASTEELRAKYRDDAGLTEHLDHLVGVDVVWTQEMGDLVDAIPEPGNYDFAFASHVFEHLVDPLGWLEQVAPILAPHGIVSLVIPDKRYCFDVNRRLTQVGDLVDSYLTGHTRPQPRHIFDFHSMIVAVDTAALWVGTAEYSSRVREDIDVDLFPMDLSRKAVAGDYVDVHVGVYTPESFLDVYRRANRLGLARLTVETLVPTQPGELEFHVVMRRCTQEDPAAAQAEIEESIRSVQQAAGLSEPPTDPIGGQSVVLSRREFWLLAKKRRASVTVRRVAARARTRLGTGA